MFVIVCWSFPVNLVSLELTYFCSGLLFAAVVQRRVWDYALTVTLVHVAVTSLGEQQPHTHTHTQTQAPETAPRFQALFLPCSDAGVPHRVAVVAGFR